MLRKLFGGKSKVETETVGPIRTWNDEIVESFDKHYTRKRRTKSPLVVGAEGIKFRHPTETEAQDFTRRVKDHYVVIQHCPLSGIALQIIQNLECQSLSLKKVKVDPLNLANAIKLSMADQICLVDQPDEIESLLQALTAAGQIHPEIQLCPVWGSNLKLVSRFMMWSHVTDLSLKMEKRDEINIRRALRLVSKLDQLADFAYVGHMRFEDFYSLTASEKRIDTFICQQQTHRENILLPKHVAEDAKLDMLFINNLPLILMRNIVALQERSGERDVLTNERAALPYVFSLEVCCTVLKRSRSIFSFRGKRGGFP